MRYYQNICSLSSASVFDLLQNPNTLQDNLAYSTSDTLQDNPAYNHIVQGEDDAEYTYARIDEFIGLNDEQDDDYI